MRYSILLLIVFLALVSCRKNNEKIIGGWKLVQYTEFDSLGDRTFGFSYSEICPYKKLEFGTNAWAEYDQNCSEDKDILLDGDYLVEEDTLWLRGFDANNNWTEQWYLIKKVTNKRLEIDLWKSLNDTTGEWDIVDRRNYKYKK